MGGTPEQLVPRLAKSSQMAGLDGVGSSSQKVTLLKAALGQNFLLIALGIRPVDSAKGDQKRMMIQMKALEAESDYLVIGLPITK